ncbi:hypothetical protein [Algoriphagus winogradskyi]|uniref:Anti-sigma factor n=1 Tax=Algoriphagus winogradskyi TaxID=237017 RepID=A0ABY1PFF1_9BACT|nr:hypothetical protein [Algoriphagus winogradskyi]SMP32419.1 hypothetical protein SAMN06265367_10814 [Algoriphagus winogradskyi]
MENWKDEILSSMKGAERSEVPAGAFRKIEQQIKLQKQKQVTPLRWLAVAACVTAIVGGNLFFILNYDQTTATSISNDSYSVLISDFNIYSNE